MLAVVAVGPSVECAVFHRSQVVGDQVGAEFIALVDDGPQRAAFRFEGQPVRVAEAAREDAPAPTSAVDFPDRRPIFLRFDTVLGDVAVRTDADIEQRAISTGCQALGPVVIDRAARKLRQRDALSGNREAAVMVRIAHDGVGVRDVEIITHQHHAEGRMEMVEKDRSRRRLPPAGL